MTCPVATCETEPCAENGFVAYGRKRPRELTLGLKRFPRQVFPMAPVALPSRHSAFPRTLLVSPAFPWMVRKCIFAIRLQKSHQLSALLGSKAGTYPNVLQEARIVVKPKQ